MVHSDEHMKLTAGPCTVDSYTVRLREKLSPLSDDAIVMKYELMTVKKREHEMGISNQCIIVTMTYAGK
jgi:hypothetical protein